MHGPDWITDSRKAIPLKQMSDEHLRNVIAYLQAGDGEHGPMVREGCSGFTNTEWIQLCATELARRGRGGLPT